MKRLFDVIVASLILFLASPLLLFGALAVSFSMGQPVLFRQTRPGYKGRPFMLYKFRTMHDTLDLSGLPLPDAERMAPFGNYLRRSS
ncbi:sugar transferase, partial [bacterium]|nr:sugar transferase [bacterium]